MPDTYASSDSRVVCLNGVDSAFSDATCAVCLEPMTEHGNTVTLVCGHTFHSVCVLDVFRRGDSRCPMCRDDPHAEPYHDEDAFRIDPDDSVEPQVNFHTGLRNAMRNHIDKPTQRMKATLHKWKATRREAREDMKEKTRIVSVLEDKVFAKIDAFENKLWAAFRKQHKNKVDRANMAKLTYTRATTQVRNAELRLAKKYGYTPSSRNRRPRAQ